MSAVDRLVEIYARNTAFLRTAFREVLKGAGSGRERARAYYPAIRMRVETYDPIDTRLSYGHVAEPGIYQTTITQPALFRDYLIEQVGGKPAPAVGWALGVERVLELVKELGTDIPAPQLDVYAIVPDAAAMPVVLRTLQQLREAGVRAQMHTAGAEGMGSMKSQFKKADASGARHALIFGGDELAQGQVTVKSLRDGEGRQQLQALAEVAQWAATLQSNA